MYVKVIASHRWDVFSDIVSVSCSGLLDLTADVECCYLLVNFNYVVVNVQQCSLLHG